MFVHMLRGEMSPMQPHYLGAVGRAFLRDHLSDSDFDFWTFSLRDREQVLSYVWMFSVSVRQYESKRADSAK